MKHPHMRSCPASPFPFSLFEEGEEGDPLQHFHESSGLTISEDEKFIYVEAAVPGIKSEDIEMTFENGILWIKAVKNAGIEDNKKKFYRKAAGSFSYRVAIPANVEETKQADAVCKNGILKVAFIKKKRKNPKSLCIIIPVRKG